MSDCNPVAISMCTSDMLSLHECNLLGPIDATQYRSMVGALHYLTVARPNISFAVKKVCRLLQAPTMVHWAEVKRIIKYLKYTIKMELKI